MEEENEYKDMNTDSGEASNRSDEDLNHNSHSLFLDRTQSDSDGDESYGSCDITPNNNEIEDDNDEVENEMSRNFPPETTDDSNESLSSMSSNHTDDDEIDDSENGSNISDPANDHEDVDDDTNMPRSTFQRELIQYLGSLFSTNSLVRNQRNRYNLEISDAQLEEYINLREKIDNELRVIGVNKFQNSSSNSDNISRNLVGLLIARERGDWDSSGRTSSCLLTYEKVTNSEPMQKCRKIESIDDKMSLDEKIEQEEENKWDMETNESDGEDIKNEPQNNLPQNKQIYSINLSKNRTENNSVKYNRLYREESKIENIGEMRAKVGNLWRGVYGSRWSTARLSLEARIHIHDGCVNALNFNSTGNWLASGSDDKKIVISDWQKNEQIARFSVGHTSNIFQVKFLNQPSLSLISGWNITNDIQLVSCSLDQSVRYTALSSCGSLEYTRLLTKHHGSCHKTDFPFDTPYVVLSAGEDQRVVSSDIRCHPKSVDSGVGVKLCTVKNVPLYSIACSPVRSQEFAVAGKSANVFIYDRRYPELPLHTICPPHMKTNKTTSNDTSTGRNYIHVTSVCYSKDGTGVLSSYNDEYIYLMSTQPGMFVMDQYSETPSQYMREDNGPVLHCYKGHRNMKTVTGVSFYGPSHEFVISGSNDGHVWIWDRETEAVVNWVKADELGVVNVLESHPYCPVVATAGLDSDIKLWSGVAADIRRENKNADISNFQSTHNSVLTSPDYKTTGLPWIANTHNISPTFSSTSSPLYSNSDDELRYEASRIELAWQKAMERANNAETSISPSSDKKPLNNKRSISWEAKSNQETCMKLPFKLEHLKLMGAVNCKLREDNLPFEVNTDDILFMSRRHSFEDDDDDDARADSGSTDDDEDSDNEHSDANTTNNEVNPEGDSANNTNTDDANTNTDEDETASSNQRRRNAIRRSDARRVSFSQNENCRTS